MTDREASGWMVRDAWAAVIILIAAIGIAIVSARPYAGSWNDGSRLAAVESLVDYHSLSIDRSIFVTVPPRLHPSDPGPYPADDPSLSRDGTRDRLRIGDHYYSDKPPVPTVLMALVYEGLQLGTGLTARERPDVFCYVMTLTTSGLAYVIAVWCIFALGGRAGLSLLSRVALTASFGLATVALTYVRHVNNHILLLGVVAPLAVSLFGAVGDARPAPSRRFWPLAVGSLAGLSYSIDLGAGPAIFLGTLLLVAYRTREIKAVALLLLGALPWVGLHHIVNYMVGGTFLPANAVPAYLQGAGGGFGAQNMTGTWNHQGVGRFLLYAASLLFGKRGFIGHNLPLFLALPATVYLARRRPKELPEILCAAAWFGGTWLVYAVGSTNSSGYAASIRWFVPLLAPAYYLLALFLRERPEYRNDLLILSGWGLVMAALMWWKGPWMKRMVPFFWPIQGAALLSWLVYRARQWRGERAAMPER